MPFLFWPLLAGGVGYVGGLFSGEAFSKTFKLLIFLVVGFWLASTMGVMK